MSILDKCASYTTPLEVRAMGIYPYFTPIQETTATEARIGGVWKIMVGSNSYLGLTHHPKVLEAGHHAAHRYGAGSTGSRFLNGTLDLHYTLEARLAAFFKKPAALVFTTGYQASLGALAPLIGRGDHVFLDRLDHASLVGLDISGDVHAGLDTALFPMHGIRCLLFLQLDANRIDRSLFLIHDRIGACDTFHLGRLCGPELRNGAGFFFAPVRAAGVLARLAKRGRSQDSKGMRAATV